MRHVSHALHRLEEFALRQVLPPVRQARRELNDSPALSLLVLTALLFAAARTIRGGRGWAVALVVLSLGWPLVNSPLEGPTLLELDRQHGITAGDLVSVAGIAVAAWRWVPAVRSLVRSFSSFLSFLRPSRD